MALFQALKEGLDGFPKFVPYPNFVQEHVTNPNNAWFASLYQYDENHLKEFESTKKIKGLRGATTDQLFFDFDSKADLKLAQENCARFIQKLLDDGFPE